MIERTTVRLPKELITRAKRKAAAEGRTLTSLIEDGLRAVLTVTPEPAKAKRILPRISKATGGIRPEFADNPARAAQEMDDLEYIARLSRGFK